MSQLVIRRFESADEDAAVALWQTCGLGPRLGKRPDDGDAPD